MSDTIKDGGPAFARPCGETSQGGNYDQSGMSLRDWFAGKAMISIIRCTGIPSPTITVAELAYKQADAMIEARSKSDA